jgi:hypothetical protein
MEFFAFLLIFYLKSKHFIYLLLKKTSKKIIMKKIILGAIILSTIFTSCKKDSPVTPAAPVITYGQWSDCTDGSQTRTYTVSGGTAIAPADSLTRTCNYSCLPGSWKMTADSVYVLENNTTYEIIQDTSVFGEVYPPCVQDDIYTFAAGGTYAYTDAGMSCSPSGSYTNGTWAITNNNFIWDGDITAPFYVIKSFSCSKMVHNYSFTQTSGAVTYHFTEKTTYTKQ